MASNTLLRYRKEPINIEAVFFYLYGCCIEVFTFIIWPFLLKKEHDQNLRATGIVLTKDESMDPQIKIPLRLKFGRHRLTHGVGEKLANIKLDDRFA